MLQAKGVGRASVCREPFYVDESAYEHMLQSHGHMLQSHGHMLRSHGHMLQSHGHMLQSQKGDVSSINHMSPV